MITSVVRRCAALLAMVTLLGAAYVLAAGPASADTPVPAPGGGIGSWEPKPHIDTVEMLLLFVGVPLLAFLVITALYVGPALARGENLDPRKLDQPESQWIGGPRRAAGELAGPDGEGSAAGGAGGSW